MQVLRVRGFTFYEQGPSTNHLRLNIKYEIYSNKVSASARVEYFWKCINVNINCPTAIITFLKVS